MTPPDSGWSIWVRERCWPGMHTWFRKYAPGTVRKCCYCGREQRLIL